MKMNSIALAAVVFPAVTSFAAPAVTSFTQDPDSLAVTVEYTIDEPGIVTVDFQKKGANGEFASIGEENSTRLAGDVNRYVSEAGAHSLVWQPDENHAGEKLGESSMRVEIKTWPLDDPPPYMAVSLVVSNVVFYYVSSNAVPYGVQDRRYKTDWMLMRRIPAKNVTWKMGSPDSDALRTASRETRHEVTLTSDYWMGVFEVTQGQYSKLGESAYGSAFTGYSDSPLMPVGSTGYNNLRGSGWPGSLYAVSSKSKIDYMRLYTGVEFDLPTEAQWEYACRAGTATQWNIPSLSANDENSANNTLKSHACMCYSNMFDGTARFTVVGSFAPNAWGLYDMHGNVKEWCLDYFNETVEMSAETVTDPKGPTSGSIGGNNLMRRVQRGGAYTSGGTGCRSAAREGSPYVNGDNPYAGFRVVAPIALRW